MVILTLTLDLYLPRRASMSSLDLAVLIIYPVCMLTPACVIAVMALCFGDGRWIGTDRERRAKYDYLTTVSLSRCTDPYTKEKFGGRRYVKVKATKMDLEAVERCVIWALGVNPRLHVEPRADVAVEAVQPEH